MFNIRILDFASEAVFAIGRDNLSIDRHALIHRFYICGMHKILNKVPPFFQKGDVLGGENSFERIENSFFMMSDPDPAPIPLPSDHHPRAKMTIFRP